MEIGLIGSQIQKFRKQRGLTQKELGEAVGVSTQAVSQWENGGTPDVALLPAIADRLGVTIDAIFGREGGPVQDMSETFVQWLRSLPEEERLNRIARLLWEASIYGVNDALFGYLWEPRIVYPKAADYDGPGIARGQTLMRVSTGIPSGYILGVGAEDFAYMGVFPEPKAGYEAHLLQDAEYQQLFETLAAPGVMETLRFFCRNREGFYAPAVVAQATGLTLEETEQALKVLTESTCLLVQREFILPDGPMNAYILLDDGGLLALLTYARWIWKETRGYLTMNIMRGRPFESGQGADQQEKVKKADKDKNKGTGTGTDEKRSGSSDGKT